MSQSMHLVGGWLALPARLFISAALAAGLMFCAAPAEPSATRAEDGSATSAEDASATSAEDASATSAEDASATSAEDGSSLRFYGTVGGGADRVKLPLGSLADGRLSSSLPLNVGQDFTLEFWMRAEPGANQAPACGSGPVGWYYGNVVIDRDIFGEGDYGDYGLALRDGRLVVGVNAGNSGAELHLCGQRELRDGAWHHIAVTRAASDGRVQLFVDGNLDVSAVGPSGRIDYREGRLTPVEYPNDPYLVLAAEKHDYPGSLYYNGWLDDLRLSNTVRYSDNFARPTAPHPTDAATVALYRFDEGSGTAITDSSGAAGGPSAGTLSPLADDAARHWSRETPFEAAPPPSPSPTSDPNPSPSPTSDPNPSPSPTVIPHGSCGAPAAAAMHVPQSTPAVASAVERERDITFAARPAQANPIRNFLPLILCLAT